MVNKINFLGIGVQKSASTWVYRILEDHPDICVSEIKELNFFTHNYDKGYQWYHKKFTELDSAKKSGEISPSYFYDLSAPSRIKKYNPDIKLIITLRDPVERAYSNHLHEVRLGHITGDDLSFEVGLENNPMYIEQSLYYKSLKNWFAEFNHENILVLYQEDILAKPNVYAKKIYEFLRIDVEHVSLFLNKKANVSHVSKVPFNNVFKTAAKSLRKIGLEPVVKKIKYSPAMEKFRNANTQSLRQIVPPMSDAVKTQLRMLFREDLIELEKLVGSVPKSWK